MEHLEREQRYRDLERARKAERAACAELVRVAGCTCDVLEDPSVEREGIAGFKPPFSRVAVHDPRCPQALAAAIEARG